MDDATIQATLAATAPVTTGMSIGAVIDSALNTVDPATLIMLIGVRQQEDKRASIVAAIPSVPTPANAAAIYAFLLTTIAEPDLAKALAALSAAVGGASASPATNTWDDVFKALMYLPASIRAVFPS